jgi:methionyl-tRNA formyltransferase
MNVFFVGSKELSVKMLEALIEQRFNVKGVLVRDSEQSMKPWLEDLKHRSLKAVAIKKNIPVYENISCNSDEFKQLLIDNKIEIVFTAFWGEIIKQYVLSIPRFGFFNLHTALLPKNRGSFPMAWAIINGDEYAGVTLHKIKSGVDNGEIVSQEKIKLEENETGISLYNKSTQAAITLFKSTLPLFIKNTFTLHTQNENEASYHPRGYPYGRQINPYWDKVKKQRFMNALYFPPFKGHSVEPPPIMKGYVKPSVRIMIGFDCDRPRGEFIKTTAGAAMAQRKIASLQKIKNDLDSLQIPRTYFICGAFLESMSAKFGKEKMKAVFTSPKELVEIADHSYSHRVMKNITTRPDKEPISLKEIKEEFEKNTKIFGNTFELTENLQRGFRTPLGHHNGLQGEHKLLNAFKKLNVSYISSDLRDENNSLHPKLFDKENNIRQPYRYENGLLEIPSIGWQDTVFSGTSATTLFETPPRNYEEIINYYNLLVSQCKQEAINRGRDIFLGLVMHPYDCSFYNDSGNFFFDLKQIADANSASFTTYQNVAKHYTIA